MKAKNKNQQAILEKLGIEKLNQMQEEAHLAILSHKEIILLSPTGTGKTLAFLLPIIAHLDRNLDQVQTLILVPSRELAIQIEQVTREMGSGFKTNSVYGGRAGSKDKIDLRHPPAILIGTPGRIADHFRKETFSTDHIKTLVLDEFDKSLEIGFEHEMVEIINGLKSVNKKILTSATQKVEVPDFVGLDKPFRLNFLKNTSIPLSMKLIQAPKSNKLPTLEKLLHHIGKGHGIIFCNLKETIQTVSDYLNERDIDHVCFYGGLEQLEREYALVQFRNGSQRILLASDLAARGIDVPALDFIIHYQMPFKEDQFTHRNGRTARMLSSGTAYIIKGPNEKLPSFIKDIAMEELNDDGVSVNSNWTTLYITGGRKDKISKGDIAGLFFKQGELKREELGTIELKQDCSFVAVPRSKANELINRLNNNKLKKKKVRISLLV